MHKYKKNNKQKKLLQNNITSNKEKIFLNNYKIINKQTSLQNILQQHCF